MSKNYFTIDTELSSGHLEDALDFIRQYYLLPQPDAFKNVTKTISKGLTILSYTAIDKKKNWEVKVDVEAVNPLKVRMTSDLDIPSIIKNLKEELFIAVQLFEDTIRQATLYFAWVEGKDIIPEKAPNERRKFSIRMFGTNMILIYILFFGVNIILFLLLGLRAAIIAIILLQVVIVLLSDRILSRTSDWKITPENPKVHILEYQLPLEKYKMFQEKYGKDMIVKMKKEIYQKSLAEGRVPSCELGEDVFQKYGFHCNAQEKVSKVIDVYSIVKTAAEKFNLPMPRVAISNTMIPNAAATGPSPSRGLVLITTGLLVQLEEDEVLAVLGHEMGHLAGRDPIILLSIISLEFILRFTVFLPIVLLNPFLYIIVVLGIIFFIAKFFETRADLLSAIKIGTPEVLAEALRKIGYQRLHAERVSPTRFPTWINYDPHPPIYFRIDRLERMKTPVYVKNPFLKSARDVFSGFRRSLSNR